MTEDKKQKVDLAKISEENLLKRRICDLPLRIEGTWLQSCIDQLYRELEEKGLNFKPECYLADEWLTPHEETVVGIPFYLADPVLVNLEKKMMLEVEGGTKEWCMKLLRHETGHAICHAYCLYKRKRWQEIFGSPDKEYTDTYRFRPYSKSFVRHLEDYYAQYHPDEDFVETFAVWLTPNLDWTNQYKGWRALKKLQYVDELMREIVGKEPPVKSAKKYWRLSTIKSTLENHYKKRRYLWAEDFPDFHDENLKRIFVQEDNSKIPLASNVIRKYRKDITKSVSSWTGERRYLIHDLIKKIQKRCRSLKLRTPENESMVVLQVSTYITSLAMNYRYTGRLRGEKQPKKKK